MGVMMRRMKSDPAGFYERLEVDPAAPHEAIAAAFRRKARVLHPDIPTTGDVEAFVRMKEAYDVLGDVRRRAAYDRAARAKLTSGPSEMQIVPPVTRGPRLSDLPVAVWATLGGLFCVAAIMAVFQLDPTAASCTGGGAAIRPIGASGRGAADSDARRRAS